MRRSTSVNSYMNTAEDGLMAEATMKIPDFIIAAMELGIFIIQANMRMRAIFWVAAPGLYIISAISIGPVLMTEMSSMTTVWIRSY